MTADVGFAQGVVIAWDEASGSNTIDVKGVRMTNLPALNIGEFAILAEGDVVGLLSFKSTYFILGRLVLPSGPDRNRASVDFDAATGIETGFGLTTTPTARGSATLTVPDWADQAIVMCGANCQGVNNRNVVDYMGIRVRINGADSGLIFCEAEADVVAGAGGERFASGSIWDSDVITDPGSTITVSAVMHANGGTWAAHATTGVYTSAVAIFRRVD